MWKYLRIQKPIMYLNSRIFKAICDSIWKQILLWNEKTIMFINLAFPDNLLCIEQLAKDRGILRLENEKDSFFVKRVFYAFSFLKKSSTLQGIQEIISIITKKKIEIRELYKISWIMGNEKILLGINTYTNSNTLKYYFIVDFISESENRINNLMNKEEKKYIEDIIDIYKPAHTFFHIMEK